MCEFPELFLMFLPLTRHKQTSQIPDICFYRYFLRSGLWAWWAKLAYQVMLTIRGRLITPFVLGSMSVSLSILIRHSFKDLWVWMAALVPWPQLLKLAPSSSYFVTDCSKADPLLQFFIYLFIYFLCAGGFIYDICFVSICSSFLL